MEVFRISRRKYIDDLNGTGAKIAGGRWNSKGVAVLYTSSHRSLAALELLVHVPQRNQIRDMVMATILIPDNIGIKKLTPENLPAHWQKIPPQKELQKIGDEWVREGKNAVLCVPSVIIAGEIDYIVNPLHRDAVRIKIIAKEDFKIDERLQPI